MPAQRHFVSGGLTKLKEAGGRLRGGTAGRPCPSAAVQLLACTATMPDSCVARDWPVLYPRGLWCQELRSLRFSAGPDAPSLLPPSSAVGTKCSGWQVSGSAGGTLLARTAGPRAHGSGLCTLRSQRSQPLGPIHPCELSEPKAPPKAQSPLCQQLGASLRLLLHLQLPHGTTQL